MNARQRMILVADDEEAIREMMRHALELYGYRVLTAGNGAEVLELLERGNDPCVILLDLMMPVMDGWQLMEKLNERYPGSRPPVVAVSAFLDKPVPAKVDGSIRKPFALTDLLGEVQRFCK